MIIISSFSDKYKQNFLKLLIVFYSIICCEKIVFLVITIGVYVKLVIFIFHHYSISFCGICYYFMLRCDYFHHLNNHLHQRELFYCQLYFNHSYHWDSTKLQFTSSKSFYFFHQVLHYDKD